jgi:hypothetical protein
MEQEHIFPSPDSAVKRLKRELGPLIQLPLRWWIMALCKGRCFEDVVVLASTCKEFTGVRRKAIVKHIFQKTKRGSYFPTLMTLYLMRYVGLPVAKQYRKIEAKPWDVPKRYRHPNWTEPPQLGSLYGSLFDADMRPESPETGFTSSGELSANFPRLVSQLAGLMYCERQLSSGFSHGGWPLKSRFWGRLLIRTWLHMKDTMLFEYVADKVRQQCRASERNLSVHWAYFLSLNRLSYARISWEQHTAFVVLLKQLSEAEDDEYAPTLSALPPLSSLSITHTLRQVYNDKFLDRPGGAMRVLVAHLQDMYISLDHPKEDISDSGIPEIFESYYDTECDKLSFLSGTKYIPMDDGARRSYHRFSSAMTEAVGKKWHVFSKCIHLTTPLPESDGGLDF